MMQAGGFATVFVDLLDEGRGKERREVRYLSMLALRLGAAAEWARRQTHILGLPIGYVGVGAGAVAALMVSEIDRKVVSHVVLSGDRRHPTPSSKEPISGPTLLVVGHDDLKGISLKLQSGPFLPGPRKVIILQRATNLCSDPRISEQVAAVARNWFGQQFKRIRNSDERKANRLQNTGQHPKYVKN